MEFSKQNKVLYVNSPLDRYTSVSLGKTPWVQQRLQIIKGKESGFFQVKDNLWTLYPDCIVESVNWLDNVPIFNAINRINNKRFARVINWYLKKLGFDDFILFNDNEVIKCHYLQEYLNPSQSVYYSRDFIVAAPYWNKHGSRLEPLVIKNADLCVANSVFLTNYCKQYNDHSYFVGQGFNDDLYVSFDREKPAELKKVTGKIIGYVGVLHSSRLDIEAMEYIAKKRPDWTLVLVGPEDSEFVRSKLHNLPNVLFLGMKSSSDLPRYINCFDVCLNPQFLTPLTVGNYPRKVDEYLAMGKPVVALQTHAMEMFSSVTYLANSNEDYLNLIDLAIREDCNTLQEERKAFAREHTWENSVSAIYQALEKVRK
ncbi:Glycosyltransferase involved in cell wall bisynthesis [Parapedobacter indicus]|uniref:Glycosyltransferase involved in cell wall bisynthesis n=1 Tax=Parapedobacter indicus TaxID=1477437 RepID=A0A1I3QVM0_9SPHI|nr:glycosyltransferase involved in cell wall biosynthesis [Parapedobacter indicus]SFJ38108.1 Glycosyltransferase involved in cell wall bisynthesis [Parapedobacter indicus]